ncbi:acyltransferase [Enterocloster sp. OA13]|uniref:acyltransferase n=1 Tax=Enterocloster sp. OA13 TaxID=2914161 RepID=UPI000471C82A
MKYIRIAISMTASTIKLWIKRILGCRVKFGWINLISPFAYIYTEGGGRVSVGNKSGISGGVEIKAKHGCVSIGNGCFINRGSMVVAHERIDIEDNVTIGPGTYIYDHDHDGCGGYTTKPIRLGKGAWIGANCVILKGVRIGEGAVIAAGGVINKDVPPKTVVYQKRQTLEKPI